LLQWEICGIVFQVKRNGKQFEDEIGNFNGKIFELWKLNIEYLLVDRDQWITVDPGTAPKGTSADDWKKLDQKAKSTIRLCLSD
jgi:hypothetical protein